MKVYLETYNLFLTFFSMKLYFRQICMHVYLHKYFSFHKILFYKIILWKNSVFHLWRPLLSCSSVKQLKHRCFSWNKLNIGFWSVTLCYRTWLLLYIHLIKPNLSWHYNLCSSLSFTCSNKSFCISKKRAMIQYGDIRSVLVS